MDNECNVYKYVVKREGVIVQRGITHNLKRRASSIKVRFPDAVIEQVGEKTTWAEAQAWEAREVRRGGNGT